MTKPHLVESLGQGPKRRMNYLILLLLKLSFENVANFVYDSGVGGHSMSRPYQYCVTYVTIFPLAYQQCVHPVLSPAPIHSCIHYSIFFFIVIIFCILRYSGLFRSSCLFQCSYWFWFSGLSGSSVVFRYSGVILKHSYLMRDFVFVC